VKRSLLVEGHGRPLAVVIGGANIPDDQLLEATIEAMVLERPEPEPDWPQHLALDAGFDTPTGWETTVDHDYSPHIAPRRPEDRPPSPDPPYPARRWVVEMTQPHYPRDASGPRVRVAFAYPPLASW
jgi:putative transposase